MIVSASGQKFSVFFAAGQAIRGVSKVGKEFFKLDTTHTEAIKCLHVESSFLWSAGDFILNCYESVDGKIQEKSFYICEDKINDMAVAPVTGQMVLNPVLACQDRTVKVLLDNNVVYTHKLEAAVTALSLAVEKTHRMCPIVGYGLRNGGIGCLEMMRDEAAVMWCLEGAQTNGSAVAQVKCANIGSDD